MHVDKRHTLRKSGADVVLRAWQPYIKTWMAVYGMPVLAELLSCQYGMLRSLLTLPFASAGRDLRSNKRRMERTWNGWIGSIPMSDAVAEAPSIDSRP